MAAKSLKARRAAARLANATKLKKSEEDAAQRHRDAEDAAAWRRHLAAQESGLRVAGAAEVTLIERLPGLMDQLANNSTFLSENNPGTGEMRVLLHVQNDGPVITKRGSARPFEGTKELGNRLRNACLADAIVQLNARLTERVKAASNTQSNAGANASAPVGKRWKLVDDPVADQRR